MKKLEEFRESQLKDGEGNLKGVRPAICTSVIPCPVPR